MVFRRIYTGKGPEGKTKRIRRSRYEPTECRVISKDDATAGDGKRHEIIAGKARLVNQIACNVFELLVRHDIPTAFRSRYDSTSFIATLCRMIPLEIVVRFEARGSYVLRNPGVPAGYHFPKPIIELYLKTSKRKWGEYNLPCDDPFLVWNRAGHFDAYLPNVSIEDQMSFLSVSLGDLGLNRRDLATIYRLAVSAGSVLEDAWRSVRVNLSDFKIEVGLTPFGKPVIADVVSPDEMRAFTNVDKQGFREDEPSEITRARYALPEVLSRHFPK